MRTPPVAAAVVVRPPNHKEKGLEEVILTDYKDYQRYVEGWIEAVSLTIQPDPMNLSQNPQSIPFTMWVNEEYLYKFTVSDWNFTAAVMAAKSGRLDLLAQGVLGPAVFTGPADLEGETLPVPKEVIADLKDIQAETEREVMP